MGQLKLLLTREKRPVTHEQLAACPNFHAAIRALMDQSGMQDKSIAIEADIDPAQLSKIASGQAGIQPAALRRLQDACGSYLPLFWLCWSEGFDPLTLRRKETDLERENRELREELAKERQSLRIITEFVKETKA